MSFKSNIKKAQKIIEDRKKERFTKGLDKDENKAKLEGTMRHIADTVKEEGIE